MSEDRWKKLDVWRLADNLFSNRLGYLSKESYNEMRSGFEALGRRLWKFYESVKR